MPQLTDEETELVKAFRANRETSKQQLLELARKGARIAEKLAGRPFKAAG